MHIQLGEYYIPVSGNNLENNQQKIKDAVETAGKKFGFEVSEKLSVVTSDTEDGFSITVKEGDKVLASGVKKDRWTWDKATEEVPAGPFVPPVAPNTSVDTDGETGGQTAPATETASQTDEH